MGADFLKLVSPVAEQIGGLSRFMPKSSTRQGIENMLAKRGFKPWDIEYAMQHVPRDKQLTIDQVSKMVQKPRPVKQQDYSWETGGAEPPFSSYQRIVSPEQEEMLGDTAYKELALFQQTPYPHARSQDGDWFKHYAYQQDIDEGDNPALGFSLKFAKDHKLTGEQFNDLAELPNMLREYAQSRGGYGLAGEVNQPQFTGHYSDFTNAPGYNVGHMRGTDIPEDLGGFRLVEEMQSDLSNKRGIRGMLRNNDVVLPDSLSDHLYVPPEIERGSPTMMTNATVMSALSDHKNRGLAIPNEFALGKERSFTPDKLPSFFKEMYGEPLNKRLNEIAKQYGGEFNVIPFRDVPRFMSQGEDYDGRAWINYLKAHPMKQEEMMTRVLRLPDEGKWRMLREGLPHWKKGGLVQMKERCST